MGAKLITLSLLLFQEGQGTVAFDPVSMWRNMGIPARLVVVAIRN